MKVVIYAALIWFGVTGCYVLVMHAQHLYERGELSKFWLVNIVPWAIVGFAFDAVFNLTFGTVMFAELPKEVLFSDRVQRHIIDGTGGRRGRMAMFWMRKLNEIDPDHIKVK